MTTEARTQKRSQDRSYYEANREAINARRRAAYRADPAPAKARASAYRARHPVAIRDHSASTAARRSKVRRAYRETHLERENAAKLAWLAARPGRQRELSQAYYEAHAEDERRKSQEWRDANPERLREQQRRYRTAHAAQVYDKNANRRARLKGATVEPIARRTVYERDGGICGICREPVAFGAMTLDHVIPLAAGGPHTYTNVQTAHGPCNSRKGVRATRKEIQQP